MFIKPRWEMCRQVIIQEPPTGELNVKINFLTLALLLSLFSCATSTSWKVAGEKKDIKFEHGTVSVKPLESRDNYSQTKDLFSISVKVFNSSKKVIKINPEHIFAKTASGEMVSAISEAELKAWTGKMGSYASAIAGAGYSGSSHAGNHLYLEMKSQMLQVKPIAPNSFVEGKMWFVIPKKGSDTISFSFHDSLKSKSVVSFEKTKKKKRGRSSASK